MWRVWIGGAVLLVVGCAFAVPAVLRDRVRAQMRLALDENAPESPAAITALVARGADIRAVGETGMTVAMVAAYWNDTRLLEVALERGVDPNKEEPNFGNTALINAMSASSAEPTHILLRAGADVNHQNYSRDTALMHAVWNGQYEIAALLLEAGAQVDLKNFKEETALTLAAALKPGGVHPMRPDLTAQDFVRLLETAQAKQKKDAAVPTPAGKAARKSDGRGASPARSD
jgi:Ankyrin repeats (3 copies)